MSQRYVYFFQSNNGLVKIGQSGDPSKRLKTLSGIAGHRLTVIGVMPSDDARAEEATIHRDLVEHRVEGEWFDGDVITKLQTYRSRFLAQLPEPRRLLQTWMSHEMWDAFAAHAKSEGRTPGNLMRYLLGKVIGVAE